MNRFVLAAATTALFLQAPEVLAQDAPPHPTGAGVPNNNRLQHGQPPFRRPHRFPRTAPSGAPTGAAGHGEPASAHEGEHGGEHGAGGHGEHAEGHHELGSINWADFSNKKQVPYAALLFNLAVLVFIFIRFGKKPVTEGLQKRKADIAKDIEEASRLKKDAEERAKKYQASLGNLDKDLETTKKGLEEAGKAEKERLIAEAEERAIRMKKDADFLLEQETKQSQVDLTKKAVADASKLAEDLLKKHVTPADHERLCSEFLMDLAKKGGARVQGAAS